MKYALSLVFLVLCAVNPAHACFACFPRCLPEECVNIGWNSGWSSCSVCMTGCINENCFITVPQKTSSGAVQVSCATPAAIYAPIRPLAGAELPGTIGVDVRVLSTDDVLIDRVLRGSPAYLAGLRPGDRLNSINEARAASIPYSRIVKMNPGESVRVTVTRKGQALKYDMVAVRLDQLNARTMSADARERGSASGGY